MSKAIDDVIAERARQRSQEGWTEAHDDEHDGGELAQAAACYIVESSVNLPKNIISDYWPWSREWWKPKGRRRNLVRAAALLIAELERMDRSSESEEAKP